MGGSSSTRRGNSNTRNSRRRGGGRLGTQVKCPNCERVFSSGDTLEELNAHLDSCLTTVKKSKKVSSPPKSIKNQPYRAKLEWIREKLSSLKIHWTQEYIKLRVSRDNLLEESFLQIVSFDNEDMRKEFQIGFEGELAQDAGGLLKEWLTILIKELFSGEMGLFVRTDTEKVAYTVSEEGQENSEIYYFVGRVLGKAMFEGIPMNCPLSQVVCKHLLGQEVCLEDLKYHDSDLYNSLRFMETSSIEGVLFENFTVSKNGKTTELCEAGTHKQLTDQNKSEYIKLRVQHETYLSTKLGLERLKAGFHSVVPLSVVSILSPEELELTLCGVPSIDIQDWKNNCEYRGELSAKHKVVAWFWEVLENMTQEQLADLLLFVTGTNRVPVEGFQSLKTLRGEKAKFTFEPTRFKKDELPRAHTCFNRLDLPLYQNKQQLKDAIYTVITNYKTGFGLE